MIMDLSKYVAAKGRSVHFSIVEVAAGGAGRGSLAERVWDRVDRQERKIG